jgi:hypothetical protein
MSPCGTTALELVPKRVEFRSSPHERRETNVAACAFGVRRDGRETLLRVHLEGLPFDEMCSEVVERARSLRAARLQQAPQSLIGFRATYRFRAIHG